MDRSSWPIREGSPFVVLLLHIPDRFIVLAKAEMHSAKQKGRHISSPRKAAQLVLLLQRLPLDGDAHAVGLAAHASEAVGDVLLLGVAALILKGQNGDQHAR